MPSLKVGISICDAVLNIKHGGTRAKTAFTLVQVLRRLSTFPSDISSFFADEVSSVFTISFCTQCQ